MVSVKQTDTIASAIEPARILASELLLRPKTRAFYFKKAHGIKNRPKPKGINTTTCTG
jgi:hypothetical protein